MKAKGCLFFLFLPVIISLVFYGVYFIWYALSWICSVVFYAWRTMEPCTFKGSFLGLAVLIIGYIISGRIISGFFMMTCVWAPMACLIGNSKAHANLGSFESFVVFIIALASFAVCYAPQVFIFGLVCGAGNSSEMGKFVALEAAGYALVIIGIWMCC